MEVEVIGGYSEAVCLIEEEILAVYCRMDEMR